MEKSKTAETYYNTPHQYQKALLTLRKLALQTEAIETCKWGMPVYTYAKKNVFGICRFKSHFGIWFYNGVFMDDPLNILENAQEGKTKAMRHWKFTREDQLNAKQILLYLNNAIAKQKEGKVHVASKESTKPHQLPTVLVVCLERNNLTSKFNAFSPYKQNEFIVYITSAKQEKTKTTRLAKIIPLIAAGIGLNDKYRK
ncbi:YdeI/OmpD-associated family protein [Croceivirga sp. JEA036]|uniref:YdeI/OmpD-associated family protein n=1 Tax=Croceivirga sp. JEA036 TaxID=2721162 RepID=UPI00143CAB24|nr:DUF1801 domain-containing protein [Croceivirga sp. JEA036]NJB37488.1 hypothetical protein [Croceivirga sp. JEA036]